MALHNYTHGDDHGRILWEAWATQSSKVKLDDLAATWGSFKGSDESIKSIKSLAVTYRTEDTLESLKPVEPWPEPVDGELLLNEVRTTINRHIVLTPEQVTAVCLWTMLTYLLDASQFGARTGG